MDAATADEILDRLLDGYPRHGFDDPTIVAWSDAINDALTATGADPNRALELARRWARTHERFPNLVEFLAVIAPRQPEPPPEDPDDVRLGPAAMGRMSSMWRKALTDVDKRIANTGHKGAGGHWHGGPDPCPLCGGQKPTWTR